MKLSALYTVTSIESIINLLPGQENRKVTWHDQSLSTAVAWIDYYLSNRDVWCRTHTGSTVVVIDDVTPEEAAFLADSLSLTDMTEQSRCRTWKP